MGNNISIFSGNILRIDIDCADPSSYNAVLALLRNNKDAIIHIVLIGRQFTSRVTPAVQTEDGYNTEEVTKRKRSRFDKDEVDVPVKHTRNNTGLSLLKYVESDDECLRNRDDEEILLQISAAHLRAFLRQGGICDDRYVIYHGGFANCRQSYHVQDPWMFKKVYRKDDPKIPYTYFTSEEYVYRPDSFEFASREDITNFLHQNYGRSPESRINFFRSYAGLIPDADKVLRPLGAFTDFCNQYWNKSIDIMVLGPQVTAVMKTFETNTCLATRVNAVTMTMLETIQPVRYNNPIDVSASALRKLFEAKQFPNAYLLIIPKKSCITDEFQTTSKEYLEMCGNHDSGRVLVAKCLDYVGNLNRPCYPLVSVIATLSLTTIRSMCVIEDTHGNPVYDYCTLAGNTYIVRYLESKGGLMLCLGLGSL